MRSFPESSAKKGDACWSEPGRTLPCLEAGGAPDGLQRWFPKIPALGTQESLLPVCILVVLKAHVCASPSSHPLCVSLPYPLPGAPTPGESLPAEPPPADNPAGRMLVTGGIALVSQPRLGICMMILRRSSLPRPPHRLSWDGVSPGLAPRAGLALPQLCSALSPLPPCWCCSCLCITAGVAWTPCSRTPSCTPSPPQHGGGVHAPCPALQAMVVSWRHRRGRGSALWGSGCRRSTEAGRCGRGRSCRRPSAGRAAGPGAGEGGALGKLGGAEGWALC